MNENWLLTRPVLDKFAHHYQTGEPMPTALVDKIKKAETFNQGFATVEYLSSALVDMKLHLDPTASSMPTRSSSKTLAELGMPKEMVMRHRLPQFGHLFSSDSYSAGYYSYLWSETMDADTWAAFEATGDPCDRKIADRFRTILLSTGNETDRAEAYRRSAAAIRTSTRCSSGAASRSTRSGWIKGFILRGRRRGSSRPASPEG